MLARNAGPVAFFESRRWSRVLRSSTHVWPFALRRDFRQVCSGATALLHSVVEVCDEVDRHFRLQTYIHDPVDRTFVGGHVAVLVEHEIRPASINEDDSRLDSGSVSRG